ncbi:MAG: Hsp20/alpha crystallin family protein [Nitrospirota bacterium]|nr:Hsp20/alpha crystallin family protein [Nitrospirota bacterium]
MLWTELERGYRNMWREMERLERSLEKRPPVSGTVLPAADVWVAEDRAVVAIELPGVDPEAVEISVSGRLLTLSGERKAEETIEGAAHYHQERWTGKFSRSFKLPFTVDSEKVEAKFNRGVLKVTLPKIEAEKPRKIAVTTH